MSVDAFIQLERSGVVSELPHEMEGRGGSVYGKNVARELRYLDGLCLELGCRKLSEFVVYGEVLEMDDGEEDLQRGAWFHPYELLPTLRTLRAHLETLPPEAGEMTSTRDPKWLLWDLEAYAIIAETADGQAEACRILHD